MTDLARAEQVRAPTMTLVVRGHMRAGLVELRKDPEDGRAKRVKATAQGRALLQAALMEELSRPARTSAPRSGSRPPGRGR
jgi:DNA-binding MarR family transcriptional regulator